MEANDQIENAGVDEWWRASLRSAFFGRPRWPDTPATPGIVAALVLATLVLAVAAHWLYIDGPARFYWPALAAGWLPTVMVAWACWRLSPGSAEIEASRAPSASALFALSVAQGLVLMVVLNALTLAAMKLGRALQLESSQLWVWGWWVLPLAWSVGVQALLLWRGGHGSPLARGACAALVATVTALAWWSNPLRLWYPDEERNAQAAVEPPFQLTPALIEAQGRTLAQQIDALVPERAGVIDVYALTFAPYADEDVFLREGELVAGVMAERLGAQGRTLQLANHRRTVAERAWATPENLERAVRQVAARMNRDEDVLFMHLTSHGARSGHLSARFWPLSIDPVTPDRLKAALDNAGIRHRVISVSACYSGSWIAPLADDNTLVMTAADAEHTSLGCGRGSEFTYFGRAIFDEALRTTRSFEDAHATARRVIEQREKEAGKDDGFSNPQIQVGDAIREHLARLAQQLDAGTR